ncbi:MAG: hypothetical protein ACFE9L_18895 [Candidatus Hodarchaeota archaeon]
MCQEIRVLSKLDPTSIVELCEKHGLENTTDSILKDILIVPSTLSDVEVIIRGINSHCLCTLTEEEEKQLFQFIYRLD